jgi:hypothetical protein
VSMHWGGGPANKTPAATYLNIPTLDTSNEDILAESQGVDVAIGCLEGFVKDKPLGGDFPDLHRK